MLGDSDGLTIGDWQVAEDISEWIEIVAITVITVTVLTAFVVGVRAVREHGSTSTPGWRSPAAPLAET